jgi:transposase-like protein
MTDMDLPQLIERFQSEDKCRAYLEALRWPQGVECPRCHAHKASRIAKRGQFDCDSCRYQFSVTAGTIFHDSHLPLWKWLLAVYMMAESKKGMSANQLGRTLKVSYKTAWYLCHRVRAAMKDAHPELLDGIVEVDETFLGGKRRGVGRGSRKGKRVIVGAVDREDGRVRLRVVPAAKQVYLTKFIKDVTHPDTAIHTDESNLYKDLFLRGREHKSVNHSTGEYVRADVHTNTVESVWSLFKRSVVGSYHQLSTKHLPAYLDEMAFRFSNRENPFLFRDTLLRLLGAPALPFARLVEKQP